MASRHHMQDRWDEAAREYRETVIKYAEHQPGKEWVETPIAKGWFRNPIADMDGWDLI